MSDNLAVWAVLSRTDPKQTKAFKRGGGFKGTAIKPIYTEQKMTETFGPVGSGWGFSEPKFQIVPGENKEVMVYCWLTLWYIKDGVRSEGIPGVGGDKIITHIKANEEYKRPERWENDDEAFKKSFTDALSNAMKHLGMSADVHMGLFEDNKYIRHVEAEIAAEERQAATVTPMQPETKSADLKALTVMGDEAAQRGSETLKVWWTGRSNDERKLLGSDRLAVWKKTAAEIDRLSSTDPALGAAA